jgi:hypothetical protein
MVELTVQSRTEIVVGSAEKKLIRVLHVDDEVGLLAKKDRTRTIDYIQNIT